ncbi:unnamed protein product [Lactuca saligna]|uniref:Uncharacterized protein n=1 Tax=Lactuca saligna TaxID=75948 RepID=A0AA36DZY5_LACSI|nr:unnamed protein product [Lactuca saligna]
MQMVVLASASFQREVSQLGRVEREIGVAEESNNSNFDAKIDDRPIPDASEQSETDDYEGFIGLGFMPQVSFSAIPQNVIYPESYFEGEIPQGTNSDTESDNDQVNHQKRKASLSKGGRAHDVETGTSAAGDRFASPPSKKTKLIVYLNVLAGVWDIIVDEVREIMIENNVAIRERKETKKGKCLSTKLAQALASADESVDVQSTNDQVKKIQLFNDSVGLNYHLVG